MNILSNFVKIHEYVADFLYVSEHVYKTCTVAQSHRLARFLELTGANLRASRVLNLNLISICESENAKRPVIMVMKTSL